MALRDRFTTGLAGPQIWALADAIDAELADARTALASLLTVPDLRSDDMPAWALQVLGWVLGVPRKGAWSDADYLLALRAQAIARLSHSTLPDLYRLAFAVSPLEGASVVSGPVGATVWLPGASDLPDTQLQIIVDAFLNTIDAVASLQLIGLPATSSDMVFTLDDPIRGLDNGLLADTLYP